MEQNHTICCAVDDDREEVQNVATKHAHVQCLAAQTSRIGAAKRNPLTIVAFKANPCLDIDRIHEAANSPDSVNRLNEWKPQLVQNAGTDYSSVRARIDQKIDGPPCRIVSQNPC